MTQEQEVEKIIVQAQDVVIYDTDIERAIADACQKCEIEDLYKAGQRQWKAVLCLVGKAIFPKGLLKDNNIYLYNNNNIPTNCNRYDYDKLSKIYDYYCLLSDKYNKLISIKAFAYFVNIDERVIENWKDHESSMLSFQLFQKVKQDRLDCIMDKAYDSPNVTGVMFVGNSEFGLNLPGVREQKPKQIEQSSEQIAERYGQPLPIEADNS